MHNDIVIQVLQGYRMICKQEAYDIADAGALLRTKKRYKYTSAYRNGEKATLTRHVIRCPFCGHEAPAYSRSSGSMIPGDNKTVSRSAVEAWASPQCSFFEAEDAALKLNEVLVPEQKYVCGKCGRESYEDNRVKTVRIASRKNKITVSCTAGMKYVLDLMLKHSHQRGNLRFPLTECVEFNLGNGRVHLTIKNNDGTAVIIRDITYARQLWMTAQTYSVIKDNELVRRALRRRFAQMYAGALPFASNELSPESFVAMTQFVGYPRAFYDTVPYDLSGGNIEDSFAAISRRMHNARYLERIYAAAALPGMKSIRKLFFSEPGFFFYIHEAEMLWSIFADPNHYRKLLELPRIYELFSNLRQYPGMGMFLRDYIAVKGARLLLDKLARKFDSVLDYAVNYCSMSLAARKRDQKTWNKKNISPRRHLAHSIPMQTGCHSIKDSCVDGYTFSWLRTKHEYSRAAAALRNCLAGWSTEDNPVVAVKKGEVFKAAIEIHGGCVVQARAIDNAPIEHDEKLHRAIEKWVQLHKLKQVRFLVDDEDDEDTILF